MAKVSTHADATKRQLLHTSTSSTCWQDICEQCLLVCAELLDCLATASHKQMQLLCRSSNAGVPITPARICRSSVNIQVERGEILQLLHGRRTTRVLAQQHCCHRVLNSTADAAALLTDCE